MSLTGRVLLSTADNECARWSSRAASSKCRSRKCDENAEDLHVDNCYSTRVDCSPAELKEERMSEWMNKILNYRMSKGRTTGNEWTAFLVHRIPPEPAE